MMAWTCMDPSVDLGLLPAMVSADDPRPAKEQLDTNYAHGGGWHSLPNFGLILGDGSLRLTYPGDPPLHPLAITRLRDETIMLYPCDFVVILQQDKSFEVARMN